MRVIEKKIVKPDMDTKVWHALYVRSRTEKKVKVQLDDMGVENYLPIITRVKQWSDRRKQVEEPLFRSYVFVRSNLREYNNILSIPGVVRFVRFNREIVVVPESQIFAIRRYVNDPVSVEDAGEDNEKLEVGQLVRIVAGPMQNLTGHLVQVNNQRRLLVYIESVGKTIPVSIPRIHVEPIIQRPNNTSPIKY